MRGQVNEKSQSFGRANWYTYSDRKARLFGDLDIRWSGIADRMVINRFTNGSSATRRDSQIRVIFIRAIGYSEYTRAETKTANREFRKAFWVEKELIPKHFLKRVRFEFLTIAFKNTSWQHWRLTGWSSYLWKKKMTENFLPFWSLGDWCRTWPLLLCVSLLWFLWTV